MKKLWISIACAAVIFGSLAVGLAQTDTQPESRSGQWQKVEKAMKDGLPRTAIKAIEPIIAGAMEDGAHAEAIRAIGQKVALEGNIQGNKPEEKIVRFEAEMADVPDEMRPVMHAILGHWYWQYFQRNRWRFMQRTATARAPGEDITTWDLSRLFAEIDKQFSLALESRDALRKIPIGDYDALLEKGTMPDSYRPTVYDFVADEALTFYSSGEQAAAKPQDAFVLSADRPVFAPLEDFIGWDVQTADPDSPLYKGVRLYQELLRYHRGTDNADALIDYNLGRLRFGYNHAVGETKNANYKAALRRFIDTWSAHELSARARHDLASVLKEEGDLVRAREIALRGQTQFPESPGGKLCYNLVQEIETPNVSLSTERVWNDPRQQIEIEYKNLTEVHFRLVSWNWEELLKEYPQRHPEHHAGDQTLTDRILNTDPAHAWSHELPATEDYHSRSQTLLAPEEVEPGFYWLVAAHHPDFNGEGGAISHTPVWVGDLAIIQRRKHGGSELQGLVLEARSGEPVVGVKVRTWGLAKQWNDIGLEEYETVRTDEEGRFRIKEHGGRNRRHVVLAGAPGRQLAIGGTIRIAHRGETSPFTRTVFFTDRAIYRPGQPIHFKGIHLSVNQKEDNYQVLANRNLTVAFLDTNHKEIASRKVRTNDYGSFSGSFTAPRDRLTGRMSIQASGRDRTSFRVEEYKRPTFQVELDAPADATRLNDTVALTGRATAYTGAPTDGARVRWRVVRETRYPNWWFWGRWWLPRGGEAQEIAHGSAETDVDGTFDIEFTARPDPAAEEEGDPTFRYTVIADVTDAAGETRSTQRIVNVGFTALNASLSAPDWLVHNEPFELSLRTVSLDGEGRAAEGSVAIYSLKSPDTVHRAPLKNRRPRYPRPGAGSLVESEPDLSDPNTWPLGEKLGEREFSTDPGGNAIHTVTLPVGAYRAVLETLDRFGNAVRAELPLTVLDPEADTLGLRIPHLLEAPSWSVEPGEEFNAVWGSGYDQARAYVEIEHRGKVLQSYWTDPEKTRITISREVTENLRGGFHLRVTFVRENRAYLESRFVEVPWSNKNLEVSWERFTSKLKPGQDEQWTAVIRGPDAETAVAEMVATLYDKSLDAFQPHGWMSGFNVFRRDRTPIRSSFENSMRSFRRVRGGWRRSGKRVQITYRSFPREVIANWWGYQMRGVAFAGRAAAPAESLAMDRSDGNINGLQAQALNEPPAEQTAKTDAGSPPDIDLDQVAARKNLQETAFFFPHLVSGEDGTVRMEFTMPEALTEWNFLGFAHDADLRAGVLKGSTVTAKDLMIQPNPPRFLREGDVLEFTVRVTNQSAARQEGVVRLNFSNARTLETVDESLAHTQTEKRFDVPAKESRTLSWRIEVPDQPGVLIYRAVGSTGRLSDGEEGYLPVLSRRIMVTESLPLPIRGPRSKRFRFDKLLASGGMDSIESKTLTLQMVSNPAWYAVMALPHLMEYPHQCAEQVFNRLYANELAGHIANADPKIRRVFDQWKGTEALDSPMEKNQDLKAVVLEETPWVRQAESESQARRDVGILFDRNRLDAESRRTLHQLEQMQYANGSWPWFPGGRPNDYITLYITTGFGRLRHLGVEIDMDPAVRALGYLDAWMQRTYESILRGNSEKYVPSPMIALYLYSRTFFLEDRPIGDDHRQAFDFFVARAKRHWLKVDHRQSQAHLALALQRLGERADARAIMRSIKERSVTDDELGMFWRDLELSWWWFRAPIETQAMMIEAFDEVMNDTEAVEDCRVWLLKQKQTQDWKTTKATADAVYALLLRGVDILASDDMVEVGLAGKKIEPETLEAGTGFYEERFVGPEIEPEMGEVTVTKNDEGVAWGSLHWQYLQDIGKITPHEGTPLTLEKALYIKRNTPRGPELKKVDGPVEVGDELVSRIVLRTDRDMEYVHLKDYRGSGTEPVNVLSRYKFQDGLRYYESTRDTASHFFIDYLPKGTYVFEYSVRVQHRGVYETGIAQVQCMYAPEFNSHSESVKLEVRN